MLFSKPKPSTLSGSLLNERANETIPKHFAVALRDTSDSLLNLPPPSTHCCWRQRATGSTADGQGPESTVTVDSLLKDFEGMPGMPSKWSLAFSGQESLPNPSVTRPVVTSVSQLCASVSLVTRRAGGQRTRDLRPSRLWGARRVETSGGSARDPPAADRS